MWPEEISSRRRNADAIVQILAIHCFHLKGDVPMAYRVIAAVSVSAALLLAAQSPGLTQPPPRPGQLPRAGGQKPAPPAGPLQQRPAQGAPQQQAAGKPYKPVNVTPPKPMDDPSFEAFRKQIVAVADKKDRAGLAGLVSK